MRVLFLQQQPCIRALKYAVGLRSARPGLELGFVCQGRTLSEWYGSGDELFDAWWRLGPDPRAEIRAVVDSFAPDVIHSHNLPDRLTVLALEEVGDRVPVIHDVHDMQSLRRTPYEDGFPEPADPLALERRAMEGAAALVAVSRELLEEVAARYRPPALELAYANYALMRDLPLELPPPERPTDGPPRLVYQGTLSSNGGHYDLRDLFRALAAEGLELDVYPAREAPEYRALAAELPQMRCHDTLPPARLLEQLPAYDFGWAGFNATLNGAHLDTALPNKAYEYVGCGLPVITLRHRALSRFVAEEEVGISVDRVAGLRARLEELDLPALRRGVAAARPQLTVEANIDRVARLYDELVARYSNSPGSWGPTQATTGSPSIPPATARTWS